MKLLASSLASVGLGSLVRDGPWSCGQEAINWLNDWHEAAQPFYLDAIETEWQYNINITSQNEEAYQTADKRFKNFVKEWSDRSKTELPPYDMDRTELEKCLVEEKFDTTPGLHDQQPWTIDRQQRAIMRIQTFKVYHEKDMDASALDDSRLDEYQALMGSMVTQYSTMKVRSMDGLSDLELDPDLDEIMAHSAANPSQESYDELKYYWTIWHSKVGQATRDDYAKFVDVSNEAADKNGYHDTGASWRGWYDMDIDVLVKSIWEGDGNNRGLKELYEKLHGHIRYVLSQKYGSEFVKDGEPIPAHILGNMWAQSWGNLYDLVEPFPYAGATPDATPALQDLSIQEMYEMADDFFTGLGLMPMTDQFWDKSVLEKTTDTEMVCHASAWDFQSAPGISTDGTTGDFRIKQCTKKTQSNFVTLHHEMGHIEYFQLYAHQPIVFRAGANPGFHEAVGDTIALSVSTPAHLAKVDLLPDWKPEDQTDAAEINYLMMTALSKIAFLPFGLIMDLFRWEVFEKSADKDITPDEYQALWDEYRLNYQGVVSPVKRTSADFDPAAKFHTSNNVPYVRYFVSFVVQFQFYERLCVLAGQPGDNQCDFAGNKAAGEALEKLLSPGGAEHWEDVLEEFLCTGDHVPQNCDGSLNAEAFLTYFKPLEDWLDQQKALYGYQVGWNKDGKWKPEGYDDVPEESPVVTTTTTTTTSTSNATLIGFTFAFLSLLLL